MELNSEEKSGMARELCEKGLWPEVLAFAQKWREENPADYRALYYIGLGLSGMRQFAEAETAYRQCADDGTHRCQGVEQSGGTALRKLAAPGRGHPVPGAGLKMDPHNKLGWSNLADMVGRLGQHDKALEFADRALALDPKFVEAYLHKAAAARALGKKEIVREVCHKLATIEPEKFRRAR